MGAWQCARGLCGAARGGGWRRSIAIYLIAISALFISTRGIFGLIFDRAMGGVRWGEMGCAAHTARPSPPLRSLHFAFEQIRVPVAQHLQALANLSADHGGAELLADVGTGADSDLLTQGRIIQQACQTPCGVINISVSP